MNIRAILVAVILIAVLAVPALGQNHPAKNGGAQDSGTTPAQDNIDLTASLVTLRTIEDSLDALKKQVNTREDDLKQAKTDQEKKLVIDDLNGLANRIEAARKRFDAVATGIDMESYAAKPQKNIDLPQEIKQLLEPMIQQLKEMTAKPRETEALRRRVDAYQIQADAASKAVENISRLYAAAQDRNVKDLLKDSLDSWSAKSREASSQFAVAKLQLEDKLKGEQSVWQSLQLAVRKFFRSRGLNLLLAILAFVATFIAFRFVRRRVRRAFPTLLSTHRSFTLRMAEVVYQAAMIVSASMAFILTLYLTEDWALLGVAILFLLGLAWTAKQALPKFYHQYRLMLNLGTVKEGERLIYNGIPWQVVSLHLFGKLVNPELSGGTISIPLTTLLDMSSRVSGPDEPWFPCRVNDWVILADGTRGKVLVQTPDSVQLILLGGARKTYPTVEFLKLNPNNISTNFRVTSVFGLDYRHQAEVTGEIPRKLLESLGEALKREPWGKEIVTVRVEFKEAGTSSLDLQVIVDLTGRAAQHYEKIHRSVQRQCVDAANRFGWTIPFPQLTVHRGET